MRMVEKVARAMASEKFRIEDGSDEFDAADAYNLTNNNGRYIFDEMARAALEAMREPTDEMVEAGVTADHGKTLGQRVTNSHRAMIDKALEDAQ